MAETFQLLSAPTRTRIVYTLRALAMLPVILWQGWETLEEAREDYDEEATKIDH